MCLLLNLNRVCKSYVVLMILVPDFCRLQENLAKSRTFASIPGAQANFWACVEQNICLFSPPAEPPEVACTLKDIDLEACRVMPEVMDLRNVTNPKSILVHKLWECQGYDR